MFAQDTTRVSGKSVAVADLPVTAKWQVWKTWDMEVKECEVITFPNEAE